MFKRKRTFIYAVVPELQAVNIHEIEDAKQRERLEFWLRQMEETYKKKGDTIQFRRLAENAIRTYRYGIKTVSILN